MDIRKLNDEARRVRAQLPASNAFGIADLVKMPPLFDWVDCRAGEARFSMFLAGNDDGVALRFFWNGSYEPTALKAWLWFARRVTGRFALDIGAHTGAYTLAALAVRPDLKVLSFEPHFMNYARLNLNLRANGRSTSAALPCGVGARDQKLPFTVATSVDYLSTGGSFATRAEGMVREVDVIALDAHIDPAMQAAVGLVKIDVEGFEAECLAGMTQLLKASRPAVFLECTDVAVGAAAGALLADHDYRFFLVDETAQAYRPVDAIAPCFGQDQALDMTRLNRIAIPNDRWGEFQAFRS
jgi:FkbM family methyltransferase